MKNRQTRTNHGAAAAAAREQRGTWVPAQVYPTLDGAKSAASRVPRTRNLDAYRPIGAFEAYAAMCEGGGALWVRYVGGDGPAVQPMPASMTVRVPNHDRRPGQPGAAVVTVTIRPHCPVCGGPRGWDTVTSHPFVVNGEPFMRDTWSNPCGHQDSYEHVITEARLRPVGRAPYTVETAPALTLPAVRVVCPKCGAKPGEVCTSHEGRRLRLLDVHRVRTDAWHVARIDAVPAARLVLAATQQHRSMHARQAADLVAGHGFDAEAAFLDREVKAGRGHLSAKQAVLLLVERAERLAGGGC